MVKKLFTLSLLVAFSLTVFAGERILYRIDKDGKQQAIPLKKGERVPDAISRLENERASYLSKGSSAAGLVDTLRNYASGVAFQGFNDAHQDMVLQYFVPSAGGSVNEIWWNNGPTIGLIGKSTVRAWIVNPKVTTIGASKALGYYQDPTDGDGNATAFKPTSGNQWFYKTGGADSGQYGFDPLGTESPWLEGGVQATLLRNQWQGIKLLDFGDSMKVKGGEAFGFTIQNDTKKSDIGAFDTTQQIFSVPASAAPFHSFKFYETGRNSAADRGWWMRVDWEWGMYVVMEYTEDRPPKVTVSGTYSTTLNPAPRTISAVITDDNPSGGAAGVASAFLKRRIGTGGSYDSVAMTAAGSTYSATTPAAAVIGDTIYWYIVATDVNGNRTQSSILNYKIFKKTQPRLLIYNNAQYPIGNSGANLIYNGGSSKYNLWSAPNDGVAELGALLVQYDNVVLADGAFPSRNLYPAIKTWIASGTASAKKNLFFTSQDYGCYIQAACADTSFAAGTFENDYLGITTLGPQDVPPTNKEFRLIPQADTLTDYLIKFGADSGSTLWYDPTFELVFAGYQDAMTVDASAKALFKDGAGTNVFGVKKVGATFNTVFLGFDAGALQFRSDTSKRAAGNPPLPTDDPKYMWIVDVGSLSNRFFDVVSSVQPVNDVVPNDFSLGQNYPNPFNPTTTIEYNVATRSNVEISIFNILGQKVATIINDVHEVGAHRATWNGKDQFGKSVASGIYFYQMRAGSFEQVKKMTLMK